ncbi:MAG: STN domain-containing protein [Phycisphaerae bacterium]
MRLLVLASIAGLAMAASPLQAQDAVQLQRALDRMVDVQISDTPIGQVFAKLTQQTGAKFDLPEETLALLPYGDQTRLTITLKNVTLRKALSPMLSQQALAWTIDGDIVRIIPKEGLFRLGRRASYDELRQLGVMYSTELKPVAQGGSVLDQLQKATANKKLALKFPPEIAEQARQALIEKADGILPCKASAWLDALCAPKHLTWYLRGDDIVVLEMKAQVERQLRRVVTLRYEKANLMNVLVDLAKKARVKLVMEPGVMDTLPRETRENFNLEMCAPVEQALQVIQGATGLVFTATSEGVNVAASSSGGSERTATTGPAARPRFPFMLRTTMPGPGGTTIEVYISPSELPPDVVDYIQAQKEKLIEQIRASMPATAPAPRPSPAAKPSPAPTTKPAPEPEIEGGGG